MRICRYLIFLVVLSVTYSHADSGNNFKSVNSTLNDSTPVDITIAAMPQTVAAFESVLKGRPCYEVIHLSQSIIRSAYETLLLCRALYLGGVEPRFRFLNVPNYEKTLSAVHTGKADTATETIWLDNIDESKAYHSIPIIDSGQFEKGLFAPKGHPIHSANKSLESLSEFAGITVMNWDIDLRLLQGVAKNTLTSISFESAIAALKQGRADYTLLRFNIDPETPVDVEGIRLYPVVGVKVTLPSSRHFVISKQSPNTEILQQALVLGLDKIKENNEMGFHLKQMGIINLKSSSWITLHSPGSSLFSPRFNTNRRLYAATE